MYCIAKDANSNQTGEKLPTAVFMIQLAEFCDGRAETMQIFLNAIGGDIGFAAFKNTDDRIFYGFKDKETLKLKFPHWEIRS